jgi:putative PIN family toxin of toxin-antitoxin system
MSSASRLVFDTSTLVGAVLRPRSVPAQALAAAWEVAEVIVSADTLAELRQVLSRARLDTYREPALRQAFLAHYEAMTWLVEGIDAVAACRDPQDDKFLALALSGGAQAIVSSDDDLLSMGQFRGVRILTPREFLDQCSWLR